MATFFRPGGSPGSGTYAGLAGYVIRWAVATRWSGLILLGGVVGLLGCNEMPELQITEVWPSTVSSLQPTDITITGRGFLVLPKANYDDPTSAQTDMTFVVRLIGAGPLDNVVVKIPDELRARVPQGLAAGTYQLEVQTPDGRRVTWSPFTVESKGDAGPDLPSTDLPRDAGVPDGNPDLHTDGQAADGSPDGPGDGPLPDKQAPDVLSPDVLSPDVLSPDILSPDILSPDVLSPDVLSPDTAPPDRDNDGIADAIDNCPDDPNTDQKDLDNDSIGDVCDPDIDGDLLLNADDPQPLLKNIVVVNEPPGPIASKFVSNAGWAANGNSYCMNNKSATMRTAVLDPAKVSVPNDVIARSRVTLIASGAGAGSYPAYGLMIRVQNNNPLLHYLCMLDGKDRRLVFWRYEGNATTWTLLGESPNNAVPAGTQTIEARAKGNSISCSVVGTAVSFTVTDNNYSGGSVGFFTYLAQACFETLLITDAK